MPDGPVLRSDRVGLTFGFLAFSERADVRLSSGKPDLALLYFFAAAAEPAPTPVLSGLLEAFLLPEGCSAGDVAERLLPGFRVDLLGVDQVLPPFGCGLTFAFFKRHGQVGLRHSRVG